MPSPMTKTVAQAFGALAAAGVFSYFVPPSQALAILEGTPATTIAMPQPAQLPPGQCKKHNALLSLGNKTHYARYNACNIQLGQ